MAAISPLALNIVQSIPLVVDRLHKYEEQNGGLDLRHANLEREIAYTRQRIQREQEKQKELRGRIAKAGGDDEGRKRESTVQGQNRAALSEKSHTEKSSDIWGVETFFKLESFSIPRVSRLYLEAGQRGVGEEAVVGNSV